MAISLAFLTFIAQVIRHPCIYHWVLLAGNPFYIPSPGAQPVPFPQKGLIASVCMKELLQSYFSNAYFFVPALVVLFFVADGLLTLGFLLLDGFFGAARLAATAPLRRFFWSFATLSTRLTCPGTFTWLSFTASLSLFTSLSFCFRFFSNFRKSFSAFLIAAWPAFIGFVCATASIYSLLGRSNWRTMRNFFPGCAMYPVFSISRMSCATMRRGIPYFLIT
mmetsp:Transcript_100641/g.173891  ORF Transcript_100641/g.173891 Transcript_100641/m.173891 type:complete len:221 (+) Transcript_100641:751-1413(+)